MEQLEKVRQWLQSAPIWDGQPLLVDATLPEPGNCGLFPLGQEVLSTRQDVAGNCVQRCRIRFLLRRKALRQEAAAVWLLRLQDWIREQSRQGHIPQLGDVAREERFRAEKGKLVRSTQTGTATYEVALAAEFTKIYEVI